MNIYEQGIQIWVKELTQKDRVILAEILSKDEFIEYAKLALSVDK